MKEKADLVRGWLRKARSDMVALDASYEAGSFDSACFHAQQAVEKYPKAFPTHKDASFPYSHNLAKLIEICGAYDREFRELLPLADILTPYAVHVRYDQEFWPTAEEVEEARLAAIGVRDLVRETAS